MVSFSGLGLAIVLVKRGKVVGDTDGRRLLVAGCRLCLARHLDSLGEGRLKCLW